MFKSKQPNTMKRVDIDAVLAFATMRLTYILSCKYINIKFNLKKLQNLSKHCFIMARLLGKIIILLQL